MASLIEKVNTLISANLHYLVDQALQSNSIAVIGSTSARFRTTSIDRSDDTVGGQVKTVKRKDEEQQAKAVELDRNIDLFLQQGREDLARTAQSQINSTQRLVDAYGTQVEQMQHEYQSLLDARRSWN